jgi:hypothetical protein
VNVLDIGKNFLLGLMGQFFHLADDIVNDGFPGCQLHFHGFAAVSGFHGYLLSCYYFSFRDSPCLANVFFKPFYKMVVSNTVPFGVKKTMFQIKYR